MDLTNTIGTTIPAERYLHYFPGQQMGSEDDGFSPNRDTQLSISVEDFRDTETMKEVFEYYNIGSDSQREDGYVHLSPCNVLDDGSIAEDETVQVSVPVEDMGTGLLADVAEHLGLR